MATVEIYTRDYCGFCVRAKRLLDDRGVAYEEHNASINPAFRDEMVTRSGRRTFPQVFVGEIHVGGSDDLVAFARSGKLDEALQDV